MTNPSVLFLVNVDTVTSVPLQLAGALAERGADVEALAFYPDAGPPKSGADIPDLGARGPVDRQAWRRLSVRLRQSRPDVLHLHHTASALAGAVTGRRAGVPAVVKTEHYDHDRARPLQAMANGAVLSLAHRVVANSRATLASFASWERVLAGRKSLVLHNGVDVDRVADAVEERGAARDRLGVDGSSFVVGFVGRLTPVKGTSVLLEAAARARRSVPELELLLLGGGPEEERLRTQARHLGFEDAVHFRGWRTREQVYRDLGALDLFVVPSRSEGFCNAGVEAMAAGLPVLGSDIPALREVLGEAGAYSAAGDPKALAEGIERAAGWSGEERRARSRAGRERARGLFSLERVARRHLELYRSLLEDDEPDGDG